MDPRAETRAANSRYRRDCQERLIRSKLPAPIKATLGLILSKIGSASDYTLAWPSHAGIAKELGCSERTIEWHTKAIAAAGLLNIEKIGSRDARRMLKEKFGHDMKGRYAHFLCFYSINRGCPFWDAKEEAETQVLADIRGALETRSRTRTRPGSNPVAGDTTNPVAGDTTNPVAGVGRALPEKETTVAVSKHPQPLEERALQKAGSALRADRGVGSPENVSEYIHTPEISEAVRFLEISLPHTTCFSSRMVLPPDSVAPRVARLWSQWKEELGVYPDPWMVEAVLRSDLFKGIRSLNWGLLTSSAGKGTPYRDRLYQGVVDQFRRHQIANKSSTVSTSRGLMSDMFDDEGNLILKPSTRTAFADFIANLR